MGIGISPPLRRGKFLSAPCPLFTAVAEGTDEDTHTRKPGPSLAASKKPGRRAGLHAADGVTLMVFYVLALQCVSTVAVVRRETNSWKWPLFQWLYMGALAWLLAFVTYQGGRLLGFKVQSSRLSGGRWLYCHDATKLKRMSELAQKQCVACKGGVPPLAGADLDRSGATTRCRLAGCQRTPS
jgi:uncharacterized integral membrane protein